jgi:hypothetical protein
LREIDLEDVAGADVGEAALDGGHICLPRERRAEPVRIRRGTLQAVGARRSLPCDHAELKQRSAEHVAGPLREVFKLTAEVVAEEALPALVAREVEIGPGVGEPGECFERIVPGLEDGAIAGELSAVEVGAQDDAR